MSAIKNFIYGPVPAGTEDFQLAIEVGNSGGYEWDTLLGFYSPSQRRYFWVEGSGCSCNSISDSMHSLSDFQNGSRDDLERAVKAWHDNQYCPILEARAADLNTLHNFKEAT